MFAAFAYVKNQAFSLLCVERILGSINTKTLKYASFNDLFKYLHEFKNKCICVW